jgi:hypothetical protein
MTRDIVEIRVHPRNFARVLHDARERGAKVATTASGLCTIDTLPVIVDSRIEPDVPYVVSHSGGAFWDV